MAVSVLIFIIGVIDGPKPTIAATQATEAHKSLYVRLVSIAHVSHHIDFPSVSFESPDIRNGRIHHNRIVQSSGGPIWAITFNVRADIWLAQEKVRTEAYFARVATGRDAC